MSEDYNYYLDENISEDQRRDVAFQTVHAVRESVTLAKSGSLPITYESAFDIIFDLEPKLHEAIITLLLGKNESEDVKYFKEAAEALSDENNTIHPTILIDEKILEVDDLIYKKRGKATYLEKRKIQLIAAKEYFTPRNQSEHKSLSHDFYLRSREEYFGKPLYSTDSYIDYKISNTKVLRLRLLHPDKEEAILGVDMIYEHFDMQLNRVRFAHMQYKTWDNNTLYNNPTGNFKKQVEKMQNNLCVSGFCEKPKDDNTDYRFPYCAGFLRPTSKMQRSDSKLITTGLHIPICQAVRLLQVEKKITKENSRDRSIKGNIFEELFNSNMTGSKWISIDELDKFYSEKNILSHVNRIRVHAQEVDISFDSDKNNNR